MPRLPVMTWPDVPPVRCHSAGHDSHQHHDHHHHGGGGEAAVLKTSLCILAGFLVFFIAEKVGPHGPTRRSLALV